jgi:predicted lipoprotein with Yx(FWY)xxD motif
VQANLLATAQRRGGNVQVTYNGHPLYYYVKDAGAARPQGQDVHDSGGEWYLVTPAGEKLEAHGGGS